MDGRRAGELSHAAVAQALERHLRGEPAGPRRRCRSLPAFQAGGQPREPALPLPARGCARARRTRSTNADTLAPVLARPGGKPLSALPVGLLVNDAHARSTCRCGSTARATSSGIDPRAVLRTDPLARTADFEPNYLACIEFDTPDFPWLFTPAAAGANGRLRPWLVLVVVRQSEDVDAALDAASCRCRRLDAPVAELPDLVESWAWAHAQVVADGRVAAGRRRSSPSQPDQNLSRLVCPRRLEPETRYLACVVPAFEAGRKAGLGEEVDGRRRGPASRPPGTGRSRA